MKCIVLINTYRLTQKSLPRPLKRPQTAHKPQKHRKYERGYLGNYQRQRIGISDLGFVALYVAEVCYENMPRPL